MLVLLIVVSLSIAVELLFISALCRAAAHGDDWDRDGLDQAQAHVLIAHR